MGSMNRKQALLCALAFIIPVLVGFLCGVMMGNAPEKIPWLRK